MVDDAGLLLASLLTGGLVRAHNPPRRYGCPECSPELHRFTHELWKELDASASREAELQREVERLRAACVDAEVMLREVLERYDNELTGAARGDVDNVRLDLLKAAEAAKEKER